MSKEYAAVPLKDFNDANSPTQSKSSPSKKPPQNKFVFKLVLVILIVILIILLIVTLTMVILRSYQNYCSTDKNTTVPPTTPVPRTRTANKYWNEHFLPPFIIPTNYTLTLQLLNSTFDTMKYNQTNTFYGLVNVYFQIHSQTNFVVLHIKHLTMQSITVKKVNGTSINPVDVKIVENIYDNFYDYMILVFDKHLKNGSQYMLVIKYSGLMTTNESGIITTMFNDVATKKKYYVLYSKLEPIGARRVFPCFDEPDKKITFVVNLIHEEKFHALSNMPISESKSLNFSQLLFKEPHWNQTLNLKISKFLPTEIPMSVYLLAFVLMENYIHKTANRNPNKTVQVWFPSDMETWADIPLNYSVHTENFMEKYFDFASPLPKTDHIYIPNFLSGAMENWGLITYREKHLLISPKHTAYLSKTGFFTIAHELAHTWFGNWVTSKTWGEIWLNEGFATYFASIAYYAQSSMNKVKANEMFLYENRQVMNKDVRSQMPIIVNVTDPVTFRTVFSSMAYHKGQFMLTWMESIMGFSGFLKAIQTYIKKYATKNPTNEQFFDVIDEIGSPINDMTGLPKLKEFFKPWLYKSGYPIVSVNYDIQKGNLILTQHSSLTNSSRLDKWPIHITYKTTNMAEDVSVFFNDNKTLPMTFEAEEFVIVNTNGKSYVRVNYSEYLWLKIIDNLKSSNSKISQISKIVLLDDGLYFAENRNLNISILKGLLESMEGETNTIPWWIFYNKIFDNFYNLFKDDVLFIDFSKKVILWSKNIVDKVLKEGPDKELDMVDEMAQQVILKMNCEANNENVLRWMSSRFSSWIKSPMATVLPKHLIKPILYYGMKTNDNKNNWMTLWRSLKSLNKDNMLSHEQIAVGLAGTSKTYFLAKLLDHYLIPNSHRSSNDKQQDFMSVVEWMLKSANGFVVLQRWVLKESAKIMKYAFGDNLSHYEQGKNLENLIVKICKSIYEPYLLHSFSNLYRDKSGLWQILHQNRQLRKYFAKSLTIILQ